MAAALDELTRRMDAAERKLEVVLRSLARGGLPPDAAARVWDELGLAGRPIPAAELRARLAAGGVRAEERLMSRGIAELREE